MRIGHQFDGLNLKSFFLVLNWFYPWDSTDTDDVNNCILLKLDGCVIARLIDTHSVYFTSYEMWFVYKVKRIIN